MNTHEDLDRKLDIKGASDRSFGWVFVCFFLLIGVAPLRHARPVRSWALGLSVMLLLMTLVRPALLHPLNAIWTRLGLFLGRIVSPIVLGLLFFLVVTPMGWLMRKLGTQTMQLHPDPAKASYWIHRSPSDPAPESMANQF